MARIGAPIKEPQGASKRSVMTKEIRRVTTTSNDDGGDMTYHYLCTISPLKHVQESLVSFHLWIPQVEANSERRIEV